MDSEGLIIFEDIPIATLTKESNELANLIVSEKDPNKLKDLTDLFKQNQLKKNLIRTNKLNNLLEIIDNEVAIRVQTSPDTIKDKDLIGYMNATQQSLQNSFSNFEQMPTIQVNKIENNLNIGKELNSASRKVVLDKVSEILEQLKGNSNVIDITEETEEVEEDE